MTQIPFIDLKAQQDRIRSKLDARIAKILDQGNYIMGAEVAELEEKLSDFCGAAHSVTCANGTDALTLALMAEGIGEGDAVFVPAFTFVATAEAPAQLGATPFFVDVNPNTFNIDPESLKQAIQIAKKEQMSLRAVISVDLFGLAADYPALQEICAEENLILIADAAQSFGGSISGKLVGSFADYTTTSFFPAKPLGCYGDGGAVFTEDEKKAELLRSLRFHGKGDYKYDNIRVGVNSRLDTLQAAILLEKLEIFADEIVKRQEIAGKYSDGLKGAFDCPVIPDQYVSAWAQYTLKSAERDQVIAHLKEDNIPSVVYYPIPLHQQSGYKNFPQLVDLSISEKLCEEVFSLPMSAYLKPADQERIIASLLKV